MSRRKRRGALSDEDRALWHTVTVGITPLHPEERKAETPEPLSPAAPSPPQTAAKPAPPTPVKKANGRVAAPPASVPIAPPAAPRTKPTPSLAGLDRRTLREIFRGARAVEGRVDLHGLTQAEARDRLVGFLRGAQARGARLVLVITGKSRGLDETGQERGVLRRMTPHWLGQTDLRDIVLGFSSAGPGHGGEGAFYVRLRRKRS